MDENGFEDRRPKRERSPIRDDDDDDRRRSKTFRREGGGGGGRNKRAPAERRAYISNIPYEMKWQDIKDLFTKQVGEVTYVNLFNDEKGKARGCGIIEFADEETTKEALEKMNRYEINGREMVVKEDTDKERDRYGYFIKEGARLSKGDYRDDRRIMREDTSKYGNTYGLNTSFLESLGIDGPLVSRIFVANLDYKVDEKKLKEVFRLAGKVVACELHRDKDGQSRGYGTIEYEHPVEAVQAISMFKDQVLFERKMSVRMDSAAMREEKEGIPKKLPIGLKSIGMGLGSGGAPLKNVQGNISSGNSNQGLGANSVASLALGNLGLGGLGALGAAGLVGGLGGGLGLQASNLMGGRDDIRGRRTWD